MNNVKLHQISNWFHKNARELELTIWKYKFENGSKIDVVNALMYYQNEDGGFGNAVDPDNWNPNSLPYATLFVINILKNIEFFDMHHPIYLGLKKYIDNESNFPKGWTFTVSTNTDYPHATYYNFSEDYNKTESTGIILGFSSFILEYYKESILYTSILELVSSLIEKMQSDKLGDMGPSGYITLIHAMKKANLTGYDYDKLESRLKELVNNSIQHDPRQWLSYGYRPSDYIRSKNSIFYPDNKNIVEEELNFLVNTLPNDDVWSISWSWFDNNKKYPKESMLGEHWWKAIKAIERTEFLRNFKRLE